MHGHALALVVRRPHLSGKEAAHRFLAGEAWKAVSLQVQKYRLDPY